MNSIVRPALGQVASLGTFYDARTDSFVPVSLINSDIPVDAIDKIDKYGTKISYSESDSYKEKFSKLNLPTDLKASFLAGLVPVRGYGSYLEGICEDSGHVARVSMHHQVTTVHEKLNLMGSGLRDLLTMKTIDGSLATHIVSEIAWGAHTVVTASHEIDEHTQTQEGMPEADVKGELLATLKSLGLDTSVGGEHGCCTVDDAKNSSLKIKIQIHSDMLLDKDSMPTTFAAAKEFVTNIPSSVQKANGGKGFPCTYTLLHMSFLRFLYSAEIQAETVLIQLGLDTLEKFVQLFDDFREAYVLVSDYYSRLIEHRNCVPRDHITEIEDLRSKVKAREAELRERLKTILQQTRSGDMGVGTLATLLQDFTTGILSPASIVKTAGLYTDKMDFFDRMTSKGAKYIGYLSGKGHLRNLEGDVYLFHFNWDSQHTMPLFTENCTILEDLLSGMGGRKKATIIIRDCDGTGETVPKPYISHERHSMVLVADIAEERREIAGKCIMRYNTHSFEHGRKKRPIKTARVRVPCPSTSCSSNSPQEWICGKCHTEVSYGCNEKFLYCHCGRGVYYQWSFQCNDPSHGDEWAEYKDYQLMPLLQSLTPFDALNILFLGETGVGKSTFINAFVNYLSYETLEEAMEAKSLNCIIPFSFTTQYVDSQDPKGKFKQTTIRAGSNVNERDGSKGQSATQKTNVHVVQIGNCTVRLFDTPGIGDTRGTQQDAENMADILSVLANYEKMHGIVILLKPNNSRLTVTFRWCIEELLTHLHRDAIHNIVFGFTNTRGSNYTPGDTFEPLKTELAKNKSVNIELCQDTVYCFDSESFRYLAAHHQGVQLGDHDDYNRSWVRSAEESRRLVAYVQNREPHLIKSTISLNETRRLITELTKPIAEIIKAVGISIAVNNESLEELKQAKVKKEDLARHRYMMKETPVAHKLDRPRTVCRDENCIEYRDDETDPHNKKSVIVHKSLCHNPCSLTNVPADVLAPAGLMGCTAFGGNNGFCLKCSHSWQLHLHIMYDLRLEMKRILDKDTDAKLRAAESDLQRKEILIKQKEDFIEELKGELSEFERASVDFCVFLKNNSITPYNDATLEYLTYLIQIEKGMVAAGGNPTKLNNLEKYKVQYETQVKIITEGLKSGKIANPLTQEQVNEKVQHLYGLKNYGQALRSIRAAVSQAHTDTFREESHNVRVRNSRDWNRLGNVRNGYYIVKGTVARGWKSCQNVWMK